MVLECFIKASSDVQAVDTLRSWLTDIEQIQYSEIVAEA